MDRNNGESEQKKAAREHPSLDDAEEAPAAKRRKTDEQAPAAKRRKTGDASLDDDHEPETSSQQQQQQDQVEMAKKKLSKWAARLFDPDRPRGLVQAPQTIPLNDEFLTAFGRREKEHDEKLGRKIEITQEIHDGDNSSEEEEEAGATAESTAQTKKGPVDGRKVSSCIH